MAAGPYPRPQSWKVLFERFEVQGAKLMRSIAIFITYGGP